MRLIFTGDFSVSGIFSQNVSSGNEILDEEIREIFQNADYVNINLENPITNAPFREKRGIALRAPPKTAEYLKDRYINICTLANNHIMDCGRIGLNNTIDSLNQNGIKFYGIGGHHSYLLLNKDNIKVALIASCHKEGPLWDGYNPAPFSFKMRDLKQLIKKIKNTDEPDYIIFSYHGGTEFNLIPEPGRRRFFHKLTDSGIDIIIGHHAHVPQGIEVHERSIIVYGLGNFCFDIPCHKKHQYTAESYFIELNLSESKPPSITKYYIGIDGDTGHVSLNNNETVRNSFDDKLQVFQTSKKYNSHWEREAFRVYFGNKLTSNANNSEKILKRSASPNKMNKRVQNSINQRGLIRTMYLSMRVIIRDIVHPARRVLLIGATKYVFKRTGNG